VDLEVFKDLRGILELPALKVLKEKEESTVLKVFKVQLELKE
jgi:hypothetical protein